MNVDVSRSKAFLLSFFFQHLLKNQKRFFFSKQMSFFSKQDFYNCRVYTSFNHGGYLHNLGRSSGSRKTGNPRKSCSSGILNPKNPDLEVFRNPENPNPEIWDSRPITYRLIPKILEKSRNFFRNFL